MSSETSVDLTDAGPYGNGTSSGAKIVAHSTYEDGPDLYTIQATGRRFILAELNTHRVLSKNSASSRAIPFSKQVARILEDLAYPVRFPREQKGMQGGEPLDDDDLEMARALWQGASIAAVAAAQELAELGVHKSVVNRLLEPFMWHTVVMTGTAWENFFNQRCSPLAQPEIEMMANDIRTAVQNSRANVLEPDEWHLPYVDLETMNAIDMMGRGDQRDWYEIAAQVSAGRCARVSYLTQEGIRDVDADMVLYERLVSAEPPHWSPLEHVATPWPTNRQDWSMDFAFTGFDRRSHSPATEHLPRVGNLLGWRSLRTEVEATLNLRTYR